MPIISKEIRETFSMKTFLAAVFDVDPFCGKVYSSTCLGSRNRGYWLAYMYFIILQGESVSTNKIGCSDSVALI